MILKKWLSGRGKLKIVARFLPRVGPSGCDLPEDTQGKTKPNKGNDLFPVDSNV
jgi:hypothetical protein